MLLSEFWVKNGKEIIVSSIIIIVAVFLLVTLLINQSKQGNLIRGIITSLIIVVMLIGGTTYVLYQDYLKALAKDPAVVFPWLEILRFSGIIIMVYAVIGTLILKAKSTKNQKPKASVSSIALMGILVALASVLMLFGIPIFPAFDFLKVEFSGLIYFMILLWFGIKPTIIVVLLTNIVHIIMPSMTAPRIFGLDEMVNVIACFAYLLPSVIVFRKLEKNEMPSNKKVIITAIIGVAFTTIFMVLYNYYINLPIIYSWPMPFKQVVTVFGLFNLIKWGGVSLAVCLLYQKLYPIKNLVN